MYFLSQYLFKVELGIFLKLYIILGANNTSCLNSQLIFITLNKCENLDSEETVVSIIIIQRNSKNIKRKNNICKRSIKISNLFWNI